MELQLFGMWVAVLGIVLLSAVDSDAHSLAQGNESDMELSSADDSMRDDDARATWLPHKKTSSEVRELKLQQEQLDSDRRATWLDTRDVAEEYKEMVFTSLQELASEGRIDPSFIRDQTKPKRGRFQGFCFRKLRSGRYMPYICWKGDRK